MVELLRAWSVPTTAIKLVMVNRTQSVQQQSVTEIERTLGCELLGTVVAFVMAWIFKKTLLKGDAPMLLLEMPPYKRPLIKQVLRRLPKEMKATTAQAYEAGDIVAAVGLSVQRLTMPTSRAAAVEVVKAIAPDTPRMLAVLAQDG